jgi:hypothetical protein
LTQPNGFSHHYQKKIAIELESKGATYMIFCGQCGLQLAPGTTHCLRCGATVDEANVQAPELHTDDATVASHSLIAPNPAGSSPASPPQQLILRPTDNYDSQVAYDATSRMEAPNYGTQQMPQNPNIGSTYGGNYPEQGGYSDFTNRGPGTYAGGYPMGTQTFQQPYTQGTNKARVTALVLILLGVLLLFIAGILFILQHNGAIAETPPPNSQTAIITTIPASSLSTAQFGQPIMRIDIAEI